MWDQPHFRYVVEARGQWDFLRHFELLVPGTLAWGLRTYVNRQGDLKSRRLRVERSVPQDLEDLSSCELFVPLHGAWLVEQELQRAHMEYEYSSVRTGGVTPWPTSGGRESLEHNGRRLTTAAVNRGELRSHVIDLATRYQFASAGWATGRPWVMNVWSCGSGKTLGAILGSFTRAGPVLVVAPAKARHVWWSQVQEYTHLKPFRVRPASERRKKELTFDEYMAECRASTQRPFVIVGAESLVDNLDLVRELQPEVLILDEIHTHGSHKRWKAIQEADGTVTFHRRKTAASERVNSTVDKENRAVAIMDVSRMDSLDLRIGLTATPLDDGRPRRLWSQLDLLCPGGFSHSYSRFALRYCNAKPGDYGGLDDRGASNLPELKARCSFMTHEVPYSESHAELPDTRVQVVYLSPTELNRADRWSDEQTFGQALRDMAKDVRSGGVSVRERAVEARLAESCSRKRRYVVDEVVQGLQGGGKVVVFTARRRETELWAHQIRRAVSRGDESLGEVPVWMAHGGVPEGERDEMVDSFRTSGGPCCLIATGQSMGTGVDGMQTADLAIFAMLPWKPGDFIQWKGRFDRLGGNPTLLKVIVAEGTYDTRVVDILVEKFGPINQFLQADELLGLDNKLLGLEDREALFDSIVARLEAE